MEQRQAYDEKQVMSRIVEVRYTDLEQGKLLCEDLLRWSLEAEDRYAQTFALTFLGDYCLAKRNADDAYQFLMQAYAIHQTLPEAVRAGLSMHLYNFLGICSELRSDEQGCVQFYLEALSLARDTKDVPAECTALNNLACAFRRHNDYEVAGQYFLEAYDLQKGLCEPALRPILLANMVEQSVTMGNFDAARRFAEECDAALKEEAGTGMQSLYNWCCYYAGIGDAQEAARCAELALGEADALDEDTLSAFGLYQVFCSSMITVGNEGLARRFFTLMEGSVAEACVDQLWQLNQARVNIGLAFGSEEEKACAYREFYRQNEAQKKPYMRFLGRAMRTQVDLAEGIAQQETLFEQQESLETEASVDELTEIYNRRFFDNLVEERSREPVGGRLAVVMFDVDYFKEYNDRYGHLEGDKVLKAVAAAAWENRTEGIYPCRFGGDELVCVCDGLDVGAVAAYIQAVRDSLAARAIPHAASRCSDVVTLSVGYSLSDDAGALPPYLLMQLADKALYRAKSSGRNVAMMERGDRLC